MEIDIIYIQSDSLNIGHTHEYCGIFITPQFRQYQWKNYWLAIRRNPLKCPYMKTLIFHPTRLSSGKLPTHPDSNQILIREIDAKNARQKMHFVLILHIPVLAITSSSSGCFFCLKNFRHRIRHRTLVSTHSAFFEYDFHPQAHTDTHILGGTNVYTHDDFRL